MPKTDRAKRTEAVCDLVAPVLVKILEADGAEHARGERVGEVPSIADVVVQRHCSDAQLVGETPHGQSPEPLAIE
jgi:hypothetical protein